AAIEEHGDDDYESNPVGTGPFKFVEWKRNDSITIEKNEDYWQEGLPKLDKVVFESIPDNAARLNALTAGEIDLADGINPSDRSAIEEHGDDDYESNPVGTGPFKFVEWKRNDSITIEKNEDYWQEGLPKLDKVVFESIPDNAARLNALTAGEIDLADGINPSD